MNRLAQEKSPYLQQHKNNPVDWYAWGEEAFAAARGQNKPIFLSIGYSTCYWCHVMEKDSFEREEVAQLLKKYFIAIKVDREEMPDVDDIYMAAIVGMTGHGGWPMSVFLTPELKPFWGGTFFPRVQFMQILTRLHELWTDKHEEVEKNAGKLLEYLNEQNERWHSAEISTDFFPRVFEQMQSHFDETYGGFGSAPKFPPSMAVTLLLRLYQKTKNAKALEMATKTLDAMACGGIYDQLGGGFHRYATDEKWLVPHFEKMLYDNALLIAVYTEAYEVTKSSIYRNVVTQTINYIFEKMLTNEGGFYSAEDAGEVEKEGEFYIWKWQELKKLLTENELTQLQEVYSISEAGNFEGNNIFCVRTANDWQKKTALKTVEKKLYNEREKRTPPHKDTKILTAWNGLLIAALAKAHQVFQEASYLKAAQKAAVFIEKQLLKEGKLLRRFCDDEAKFAATLDDYAYFVHGLLQLYQSGGGEHWLTLAKQIQAKQEALFWDAKDGIYVLSEENKYLLIRKKEIDDSALPSPNAIAALNLLYLYQITKEKEYLSKAQQIFAFSSGLMHQHPRGFCQMLIALEFAISAGFICEGQNCTL